MFPKDRKTTNSSLKCAPCPISSVLNTMGNIGLFRTFVFTELSKLFILGKSYLYLDGHNLQIIFAMFFSLSSYKKLGSSDFLALK
jgi:hypothetical protein